MEEPASPFRSRRKWGPETPAGLKVLEEVRAAAVEDSAKRKRRSRWAPEVRAELPGLPGIALPQSILALVQTVSPEAMRLQQKLSQLNQAIQMITQGSWVDESLYAGPRSPSPEPTYDHAGVRTNTRELRLRDKLNAERNAIIIELIKTCPSYKPPSDWRPPKISQRLYIPVKEHPGYNFIGLIIGPRGTTQKEMEKKTGAKIAIRGRGSVKDGRQRIPGKREDDEDEDLHVLITADTQAAVDEAVALVKPLLEPIDEAQNEHKRLQLRELALMNGTLRDLKDENKLGLVAGETRDGDVYQLPDKVREAAQDQYARDVARVHGGEFVSGDQQYQTFLAELGGNGPPGVAPATDLPPAPAPHHENADFSRNNHPRRPGLGASRDWDSSRPAAASYDYPHAGAAYSGHSSSFAYPPVGSAYPGPPPRAYGYNGSLPPPPLPVPQPWSEGPPGVEPDELQNHAAGPGEGAGPVIGPHAPVAPPDPTLPPPPLQPPPLSQPSAYAHAPPAFYPGVEPGRGHGGALFDAAAFHAPQNDEDRPPGDEDFAPDVEQEADLPGKPSAGADSAAEAARQLSTERLDTPGAASQGGAAAPAAGEAGGGSRDIGIVAMGEEQRKAVQRQRAREEEEKRSGEERRARLLAAAAAAALQSAPPLKKKPPPPKPPPKKEVLPEPSESGELICSDDDEAVVDSKAKAAESRQLDGKYGGGGRGGDCRGDDRHGNGYWDDHLGRDVEQGFSRGAFRGGGRQAWGDRFDRRPARGRGSWD